MESGKLDYNLPGGVMRILNRLKVFCHYYRRPRSRTHLKLFFAGLCCDFSAVLTATPRSATDCIRLVVTAISVHTKFVHGAAEDTQRVSERRLW